MTERPRFPSTSPFGGGVLAERRSWPVRRYCWRDPESAEGDGDGGPAPEFPATAPPPIPPWGEGEIRPRR
jgi:hypothetical protein